MSSTNDLEPNVKQLVLIFGVTDMRVSLHFYVDGLGFQMKNSWVVDGEIRWCWLELGGVAIMLQTFYREGEGFIKPAEKLGVGVLPHFICVDALAIYHDLKAKGIQVQNPFVGNGYWVVQLKDPDGYELVFESPTDVAEDTDYAE
jgi:lactoylglutathione lyase